MLKKNGRKLYYLGQPWSKMAEIIVFEARKQGVKILKLSQEFRGPKGVFVDGFDLDLGNLSPDTAVRKILEWHSPILLMERATKQLGLDIKAKSPWN